MFCVFVNAQLDAFSVIPTDDPEVLKFSKNGHRFPVLGHLQGVQKLDDRHLVISGSGQAYFFIVRWSSAGINANEVGQVIKLVKIKDDFPEIKDKHAGGIQIVDNVLAIGTEKNGQSNVVFYDLSNPNNPVPIGNKIFRNHNTAGAVGLVRQANNYLLVVGAWNSDEIDFYTSDGFDFSSFTLQKTWKKSQKDTSGWIDENWGRYQGLNLIREQDGQLHLVGFHRSKGEDWVDLYSLDINANASTMLKKVDGKQVYCIDGASFRYSGGLCMSGTNAGIALFATERRVRFRTVVGCLRVGLDNLDGN